MIVHRYIYLASLEVQLPGVALLPPQPHFSPIILVYYLVEHDQSADLILVAFGVIPVSHFSDPAGSLHEWVVAGVALAPAGVGGVEVALVLSEDLLEDGTSLLAHGDAAAERLYFDSAQIQLLAI